MRVSNAEFIAMGLECAEETYHLPALYHEPEAMWRDDHMQVGFNGFKGMNAGDINTPHTSARAVLFWLLAPMNTTVMAGASQGRGRCIIISLSHDFLLLFVVLCWLGTGSASSKPLSISPMPTAALSSRPIVCVFGLRHISPRLCSVIHKGDVSAVITRPRQ